MDRTVRGVDYSQGTPNYDGLKSAGVQFVMRYISHNPTKDLTLAERRELHKRGISVGVVFESTEKRPLAAAGAGVADAQYADARVRSLGLAGIPIYFAVDWDVTPSQKPVVAEYLAGAASVIGKRRTGVYGGYWVIKHMVDHGVCSWFWQTSAWSGGNVHSQAHIHQYQNGAHIAGIEVDRDLATASGFGARGPAAAPPFHRGLKLTSPYMVGDDVRAWQEQMIHRGWDLEATGIYAEASRDVCLEFQIRKGLLPATGEVGPRTWRAAWDEPIVA